MNMYEAVRVFQDTLWVINKAHADGCFEEWARKREAMREFGTSIRYDDNLAEEILEAITNPVHSYTSVYLSDIIGMFAEDGGRTRSQLRKYYGCKTTSRWLR